MSKAKKKHKIDKLIVHKEVIKEEKELPLWKDPPLIFAILLFPGIVIICGIYYYLVSPFLMR